MRVQKLLSHVTGPDVLDIGCAGHLPKPGSPYWLHGKLREKFPNIVGVDLNEVNVEVLKKQGFRDLYVASAESFELGKKFDTIVSGELIEHLSNPGLFLLQCKKHIKPDGRIVLSTPYVFSLFSFIYAFLKFPDTCENKEHAVWFCPRTLTELSNRSGFDVIHWELIEDYELDNPSIPYKIFAGLMVTVGRILIPGKLRKNAMVFVLTPSKNI